MSYPNAVRIVEVGPRDGLQNEVLGLSVATRVELVERLVATGLGYVEVGSFVSPKWVPQMAGSEQVFEQLAPSLNTTYAALTPNMQGLQRAIACGVREVAVFAAASESFSQKNINCSIAESLRRFAPVVAHAQASGIQVRGYISCVLGCPYDGVVSADAVLEVTEKLLAMGCYEVSLGDTIGVGTAASTKALLAHLTRVISVDRLAVHLHDTYGQALANILVALQMGISVIDSSVAGLGGCPYAKGASGNVATEDLVYLLNGAGVEHGVDLNRLITVGHWICQQLNRVNGSRTGLALKQSS